MRTTLDLIEEMQTEAKTAERAALIVGLEKGTKYVWSSDDNPLETLNQFVEAGGEPVGIVRVTQGTQECDSIDFRPLEEYANQEWVKRYLSSLAGTVQMLIVGETLKHKPKSDDGPQLPPAATD